MNDIKKLYSDLSDDKLRMAVKEIENAEQTGVFGDDSIIRNLCKETANITNMDVSSNLLMVQFGILKEAAYRWMNSLPAQMNHSDKELHDLLEKYAPWEHIVGAEAEEVRAIITLLKPINTSDSLHLYQEIYLIEDVYYKFTWAIGGDKDIPIVEKKPRIFLVEGLVV